MSVLTLNNHNAPVFVFVYFFKKRINTIKTLLNIYVRHAYFVKVLYLIVGACFHDSDYSTRQVKDKRQKHKSNAVIFHITKGGAVPTLTHQMITGR